MVNIWMRWQRWKENEQNTFPTRRRKNGKKHKIMHFVCFPWRSANYIYTAMATERRPIKLELENCKIECNHSCILYGVQFGCHLLEHIIFRMLLNSTFLLAIDAAHFRMNVFVNGVIVRLMLFHIFDSLGVDESFVRWAGLHSEYQLPPLISTALSLSRLISPYFVNLFDLRAATLILNEF